MFFYLITIAVLIISALSFYAGKLLFLLSQQKRRQKEVQRTRVINIVDSIETILKALSQQQCELSEATIRVCNLLEALPISPKPKYNQKFPNIFELFVAISGFATLDARKALDKATRLSQDKQRYELESKFESAVLKEIPAIDNYCKSLR